MFHAVRFALSVLDYARNTGVTALKLPADIESRDSRRKVYRLCLVRKIHLSPLLRAS